MAMEDYFKNSPFGRVAGGLLSKDDDDYKEDVREAIGFQFLSEFLTNL